MDDCLRAELLAMASEDQAMRRRLADNGALADPEVDRRNTARLKEIVEARGFPGKSLVGEDGAGAAWLLVQHAPDRAFHRRCLDLIRQAVDAGEASPRSYAYLLDRVRMFGGEPQVYGTQYRYQQRDMHVSCHDIEDVAGVDERRRSVGLGPLSEQMLEGSAGFYAAVALRVENARVSLAHTGPDLAHARVSAGDRTAEFDLRWEAATLRCLISAVIQSGQGEAGA